MVESADTYALRAATSVLIERMQFMRQAGITFGGKRDLYEVLGYNRIITNKEYRDRYLRGGIAKRIVEALPKATWRGGPEVIEDEDPKTETAFEAAFLALVTRMKVWEVLKRADILAGLSNYSVLLIGAAGPYDQELPKGTGKPDALLFLTPFTGGGGPGLSQGGTSGANYVDATIQTFEQDTASPRFGLPTSYQLRRLDISSPEMQKPVHWSRIIHIAEGCLDNEVYGIPTLENVWNLLDDLDKVTGGGAEAFWLRANQGLHLMVDKDAALTPDEKTALKDQAEEYQHQMRRILQTRKVDVQPLGSDTANFSNPADAILTQIAGSKGIPKRILTGSEMGELASSQDRDNWKDQVNGRQTGYAEEYMIRPLVDRLIAYNYLPATAQPYQVRWAHIETLTEDEKATGATKWATVNQTQGTTVFTDDEIRDKWYGMEPLTPEQKAAAEAAKPKPEPPPAPFGALPPGAGGDEKPIILAGATPRDLFQVLERAIVENDTDTIDDIIGIRHAGGPGSGNFGHGGRPGEVGGSGEGSGGGRAQPKSAPKMPKGYEKLTTRTPPHDPQGHGAPQWPDSQAYAAEYDTEDQAMAASDKFSKEYGNSTWSAKLPEYEIVSDTVSGPQRSNNFYKKWVHEVHVRPRDKQDIGK